MGPTGTYGNKWQFTFIADNGFEYLINIRKKGYSGTSTVRPLGSAPVLKRDKADSGICGTSLEIYAEAQVDGEYAELYTSDAREFFVEVLSKSGNTWATVWLGFVTPELYSEPDIAPPYDVQIIATDGLGELKSYTFPANGRQSLITHIKTCLDHTGLITYASDIALMSGLYSDYPVTILPGDILSAKVDLDNLAGESCYDVLSSIMTTLNAQISYSFSDGLWMIMRENDVDRDGWNASGSAVQFDTAAFGSMTTNAYWPVGQLSSEVIPAKNRVSVILPYTNKKSLLLNPDLDVDEDWTKSTQYITWEDILPSGKRPLVHGVLTSKLSQDIAITATNSNVILNCGLQVSQSLAVVQITLNYNGEKRYLAKNGEEYVWTTTAGDIELQLPILLGTQPLSAFSTVQITLPGIPYSGTLTVAFIAKSRSNTTDIFQVGWAYLVQATTPGYKDTVVLGNGAREEDSDVEIAFGDAPYSPNALNNIHNILTDTSGVLTGPCWKYSRVEGAHSFLELMAIDHAITDYLPRLKYQGKLHVGSQIPPLLFTRDGMIYICRTMSWNLLDSEMDCELIQQANATDVTVTSSTIVEISEGQVNSGSGGGSSGGSGGTTDYNDLSNKPSINGVSLQGNHDGASLQLIGYDVISYDDGDGTITLNFQTRVNIADAQDTPVYRWVSDLLAVLYTTQGNITVDASLIPTSNRDLGSQGHEFDDGYIDNLWPEKVEFHDGSKIYEINSQLRLFGHNGVIIADDTNLSSLVYGNGEFVSTELDNLGSEGEPWNEVWANAFYVDYDIVDGNHWPKGFRWNSGANHFELIGPTYFYGGDFLPMASYQGSAVDKMLGNMYFQWDYCFSHNIVFDRDPDDPTDINKGFGWVAANSWILCNTDINFSGNVYINGQPISASDESMKDNVEDLTDVAKILAELRAVNFDWKDSGQRGHGFIAQEVEKVLPDIVHKRGDGLLGLDYISLIAYLVRGWQEQQDRITKLEIMVKQLMDKIK